MSCTSRCLRKASRGGSRPGASIDLGQVEDPGPIVPARTVLCLDFRYPMTTLTYLPQVFDVLNMQSAREVILTHEGAASAEERWQTETPYVADLIEQSFAVTSETIL